MASYFITAIVFDDNTIKYTSQNLTLVQAITFYNNELNSNFATVPTLTTYAGLWWPSIYQIYTVDMNATQQANLNVYAPNALEYTILAIPNETKQDSNVLLGTNSGSSIVNTIGNTIVGASAGQQVSTLGPITAIGYQAGKIATRPNTIVGYNAGNIISTGSSNLCIGNGVASSLETGSSNTLLGEGVGIGYTGSNSVCIGSATTRCGGASASNVVIGCGTAGFSLTTGSTNVLVGPSAGSTLTTGSNCVAIGSSARCGTTSSGNVSVGRGTATNLTTGATNVFMGDQAGAGCTVGSDNVCIGASARCGTTSTGSNVVIGKSAGTALTSGTNNIFLGASAGSSIATNDNNIMIGATGTGASESNTIRLGTSNVQTSCYIAGISGQTATGSSAVYISNNGQLGTVQSSRRYKKHIEDINQQVVDNLLKMPVKSFRYSAEADDAPLSYGMIAEDMVGVDNNLVLYDDNAQVQSIKYNLLIPLLVAKIQQLETRLAQLEK